MKFFQLINAFEKKDIGRFPGLKSFETTGYWDTEDSLNRQGRDSKVVGNPALPIPEMYKSVKMTDLLDIIIIPSNFYQVITERFLNFLKPYIKGEYQIWKIDVKRGDEIYDYYILHIDNPKKNFVDYDNSVFKLFRNKELFQYEDLNQEIKIKNDKEYFETIVNYLSPKVGSISLKSTKIVFNTSKTNEDFFRSVSAGLHGYYVSENLKNEIEKQGFTGLAFKELKEIDNSTEIEEM